MYSEELKKAIQELKDAERSYNEGCHITSLAQVYHEQREEAREKLAKILKKES